MQAKTMTVSVLLMTSIALGNVCFAQDAINENEVQLVREQLLDLQRQLKELREQHTAEIEALKVKIDELSRTEPEVEPGDDIDALRRLAEAEAEKPQAEEKGEEAVFTAGALSLQALNPEISVTGDMLGTFRHTDAEVDRWKFKYRNLGIHIESYLDPYTRFKAAVPVNEEEAKIGEAYMTRFGILENVNLTLGKFRQQFGVVNRWHKHGLDQVDFPFALRKIFGDGGLNQTGLSLDWTMPSLGKASQELTLQITNGENKRLFGGNKWDTPSILMHYKNFRDLTENTYLEFGATGLLGWNDEWPVSFYDYELDSWLWRNKRDKLPTWVYGADLTLTWEPTGRMRYRNLEWRSELYVLDRKFPHPYLQDDDTLHAWGAYSYVQTKLSRKWEVGLRADYYKPDHKGYAGLPTVSLMPLAYPEKGVYQWQVSPYITWYQSPFVKVRLEYDHLDGHGFGEPEDMLTVQVIFAAGPHKHERY